MAEVFERLLPASFRLIPFLVTSSTLNAGRKIITHEYPNETFRYDEDLGGKLRKFSLTAVVSKEYFERRTLLIAALNQAGSGLLIHPFYGAIQVSVPNYYIREMNSEIGRAVIDIDFEETGTNIFPLFGLENISGISDLIDSSFNDMSEEISTRYIIKPHAAKSTVGKQEELHSLITEPLPPNTGIEKNEWNTFNESASVFYNDRFNSAQNAQTLADNTSNLFNAFDGISNDFEYRYKLYSKLFGRYGENDKDILASTQPLEEQRFNRKFYNGYIKSLSLIQLFLNATKFEYKDVNDLSKIIDDLTDKYNEAVSDNNFTEQTWEKIEEIRAKTLQYLSQLKINKIIETTVPRNTITTLIYNYYESFDNLEEILKLNYIVNPSIIEGDLKIVAVEEGI